MSVYKSSTLGEIPLSFTGKHHLQNLRTALEDLIRKIRARNGEYYPNDWEELSRARGHIAKYMSELERKNDRHKSAADQNYGQTVQRPSFDEIVRASGGDFNNLVGKKFVVDVKTLPLEERSYPLPPLPSQRCKCGHSKSEWMQQCLNCYQLGVKAEVRYINYGTANDHGAKPPPPEVHIKTEALIKELERRGAMPKPVQPAPEVNLPPIPEGYVLRKLNGLLEIVPHVSIENAIAKHVRVGKAPKKRKVKKGIKKRKVKK